MGKICRPGGVLRWVVEDFPKTVFGSTLTAGILMFHVKQPQAAPKRFGPGITRETGAPVATGYDNDFRGIL